ncbi:hypothetical protein ETU08_02130 [Apibacter muscae]|uniref:hypothetical protein n=1 Tax=Apibacter muscae TaxID=2509004 RepID=UPI0011ABF76F|nr:hypothetical protein [Apibacter muscae]TWP30824.1 hypothetical protein ETU08_02130 [Apibacter muscae]
MKKTAFYIGIFLFSTNLSFSRKTDKIKELKSFALSVCIQDNYKKLNPEFDSKDYTNSFIVGDIVTISTPNLEILSMITQKIFINQFLLVLPMKIIMLIWYVIIV